MAPHRAPQQSGQMAHPLTWPMLALLLAIPSFAELSPQPLPSAPPPPTHSSLSFLWLMEWGWRVPLEPPFSPETLGYNINPKSNALYVYTLPVDPETKGSVICFGECSVLPSFLSHSRVYFSGEGPWVINITVSTGQLDDSTYSLHVAGKYQLPPPPYPPPPTPTPPPSPTPSSPPFPPPTSPPPPSPPPPRAHSLLRNLIVAEYWPDRKDVPLEPPFSPEILEYSISPHTYFLYLNPVPDDSTRMPTESGSTCFVGCKAETGGCFVGTKSPCAFFVGLWGLGPWVFDITVSTGQLDESTYSIQVAGKDGPVQRWRGASSLVL